MITFERYYHNSRLEFFEKVFYKGLFLINIPSSIKSKVFHLFSYKDIKIEEKEGKIIVPFIIPMGLTSFPKKGKLIISKDFSSLTNDNKYFYAIEDDIVVSKKYEVPEFKNIIENNKIFTINNQQFIFKCTKKQLIIENVLS